MHMKPFLIVVGTAILTAVTCTAATGLVITYRLETLCQREATWCLGLMSRVVQTQSNAIGGPQGLEGYVVLDQQGVVRLAIGTIGNIEIRGAGHTEDVRGVQSGGVFTGLGTVDTWTAFTVHRPQERRAGQIRRFNAIKFGNGWSFVEDGDKLFLCPPRSDRCHSF